MRPLKILTIILLIASSSILSACSGSSNTYTTPPESFSLEDAGKLDLKLVDLGKLQKTKIDDVSGVSLHKYGQGYDIKYRYLNSYITVKIVKFHSPNKGNSFWARWVRHGNYSDKTLNGASVVSFSTKRNSVIAWQKDSWFTYIAVPAEIANHQELVEEIREYINYQYENL